MGWVRDEPQDLDFFLTFTDSFLGRCRPLALDATRNPLPPPDQLAQIKMPLKAAEWNLVNFSDGTKTSPLILLVCDLFKNNVMHYFF
jgi:hypothetical protein